MAVVVDENVGRSLQYPSAILHQALRVIDHWMIHSIRIAPASVQVLVRQTVSIAVDNESTSYRFKNRQQRKKDRRLHKRNRTLVPAGHFAECHERR